MIRYEYDDDFSQDQRMPVVKCETVEVKQEVPSEFADHDWVSAVDPFCSDFNSREGFPVEHYNSDLGSFAQEDFSGLEAYIGDYSGPLDSFEDAHAWPVLQHVKQEPLRARDTNSILTLPPKPKRKIKQPTTRRPIDEFQTKNGFKKPNFSYSCLIGLALKNSESGELTVSEIYRFLCEYFPFFREAPSGWKNSVRHNLSLNKCFEKVEVEVPDAQGRKSCLWRLNPLRADKMAAEIQKWRERSQETIDFAMADARDLEDIVHGRKGIPPLGNCPAEDWFGAPAGPLHAEDEDADFADENEPALHEPGCSSRRPPPALPPSAHEKAARKLECLLESKKQCLAGAADAAEGLSPPVCLRRPLSIRATPPGAAEERGAAVAPSYRAKLTLYRPAPYPRARPVRLLEPRPNGPVRLLGPKLEHD